MDTILPMSLDEYLKYTSLGSIRDAGSNAHYGINRTFGLRPIPRNNESQGLCFFTRPQLNLQTNNLINHRQFYPYLTPGSDAETTPQRYARCVLDPRLGYNLEGMDYLRSRLLDNSIGFIPILTNSLKSLSGWSQLQAKEWTSKPGLYGEEYAIVDGSLADYKKGNLTATFINTRGNTIVHIFYLWLWYMSLIFEGGIVKYHDFYSENTIDYNTRIYKLTYDSNRRVVPMIAATGVAWPMGIDIHEFFDHDSSKRHNEAIDELTVPFSYLGTIYNDDLLYYEFNQVSVIHNRSLLKPKKEVKRTVNGITFYEVSRGERELIKIPPVLSRFMENRGVPYIDYRTYELEWWVTAAYFDAVVQRYVEGDIFGILAASTYGLASDRTILPTQANADVFLDPYL